MRDHGGHTPVEGLQALEGNGLVLLAAARLARPAAAPPPRRIPSLYADPASWAVLEAVDELWAGFPDEMQAPETTAMVLVSTHGTVDTMAEIARAAARGRLSPMRFAGASAGGPISLVCMVHGLRGPTLVITTDPANGLPAARTMARHWLRTGAASHVVVAAHDRDPLRGHEVRCVVAGPAPDLRPSGAPR
ncbi:coronafacic acid synthetase [Nonomuraea sp. KC401]|uniref:beta-ketoacyl synthase N-terminal-like domain-containing protein n=1 Tax=unclassified Nonomuraea TaxID=2593643 RepID=UPI0010FEA18A|nr:MULTISPECIES: beta-ketoacyl synthase N-terminal-like domain-containing protein [unclassified Nonomuraea]NBE96635.1 coronafacic acid synthetase [Nonomuraea sp. K271]TLF73862.1 coronafacic acid synthetase [Nonomuraea sp. KC401]